VDQTMPSGIRGKLQQQRVRLKSLGRSCRVLFTVQDPEVTAPMRSHSRLNGRNQADAAIFAAPRHTIFHSILITPSYASLKLTRAIIGLRSPIGRRGEAA